MSDNDADRRSHRWLQMTWRPVPTYPLPATIVGVAASVAVGLALIPLRETIGSVSAALVMAAITVISAEFGGRTAGVAVGVAASVSFNVFHTEPYYALVIDEPSEAIAAGLLAVLGVLIGSWHRPHSEP